MDVQIVDRGHPSYGCKHAWFMFGIRAPGGGVSRILLVEAKNAWAVQTLEIILAEDGAVSGTCSVLVVHRDCESIGIRAEIVQEVEWVDFMLDIVEHGRILANAVVSVAFRNSLTPEEQRYASKKIDAMNAAMRAQAVKKTARAPAVAGLPKKVVPAMPDASPIVCTDEAEKIKLIGGLVHLGFKKQEVVRFVDSLGPRVGREKLEDLVRIGIQELAA